MDAKEVINTIRESTWRELTLREVLAVLEDGEALANLGFTDKDQEAIEEAHASITAYLEKRSNFKGGC